MKILTTMTIYKYHSSRPEKVSNTGFRKKSSCFSSNGFISAILIDNYQFSWSRSTGQNLDRITSK